MVLNRRVMLPPDIAARANGWAAELKQGYADGRFEASRAFTCFDADKKLGTLEHAKKAECAFAIFAGLDPLQAVHWDGYPDDGSDVLWDGLGWDVKATIPSGEFLIWPFPKNEIFHSKDFDRLVLVKGGNWVFEINGWVSKEEFWARKKVAPEGHKLFPGTWHMHQDELRAFGKELNAAE